MSSRKDLLMRKFSVFVKNDAKSQNIKTKITERLLAHNYGVDEEQPDLVVCVGGDGTILSAVHHYLHQLESIEFVAIHTGTLGFFTDYTENEVDRCIQDIIDDNVYEVFSSYLLEANVNDYTVYALNEIRVENILRTQVLDIYIDDEFFETFKGNGMCLSTQAGSTAYNRSLDGAVIDSGIRVMQLTEIAGIQDSKHRSLRVPYLLQENRKVTFVGDDFTNSFICYDHKNLSLDNVSRIECKMSNKRVKFVRYRKYSYLDRVRNLY